MGKELKIKGKVGEKGKERSGEAEKERGLSAVGWTWANSRGEWK